MGYFSIIMIYFFVIVKGVKGEKMNKCPICHNTQGFVFGTCCRCGYNYIEYDFHWIEVNVEDLRRCGLSEKIIDKLIEKHYRSFNKNQNE